MARAAQQAVGTVRGAPRVTQSERRVMSGEGRDSQEPNGTRLGGHGNTLTMLQKMLESLVWHRDWIGFGSQAGTC